jgi:hypothetical protein
MPGQGSAAGRGRHILRDLLNQRVFGTACGRPAANDADRLADDPIHKLLLGRDPNEGLARVATDDLAVRNRIGAQVLFVIVTSGLVVLGISDRSVVG